MDSSGRLYIADPERDTVWMITVQNVHSTTLAREDFSTAKVAIRDAHVHALALDPGGRVLAESQAWDPSAGLWTSVLWHLNSDTEPTRLSQRSGPGFFTATSSRTDRNGRHYAWDVDMADQTYSRFMVHDSEHGEQTLFGGEWRDEDDTDSALLGNIGDFMVTADGELVFTDHDCLRSLLDGRIRTLACGDRLKRPFFSMTFGDHNHLRGLTRDRMGHVWVTNYAAEHVVRIGNNGIQAVETESSGGYKPVGVFVSGHHLFVLEHSGDGLNLVYKSLPTGTEFSVTQLPTDPDE